jgi:hypothetical protein
LVAGSNPAGPTTRLALTCALMRLRVYRAKPSTWCVARRIAAVMVAFRLPSPPQAGGNCRATVADHAMRRRLRAVLRRTDSRSGSVDLVSLQRAIAPHGVVNGPYPCAIAQIRRSGPAARRLGPSWRRCRPKPPDALRRAQGSGSRSHRRRLWARGPDAPPADGPVAQVGQEGCRSGADRLEVQADAGGVGCCRGVEVEEQRIEVVDGIFRPVEFEPVHLRIVPHQIGDEGERVGAQVLRDERRVPVDARADGAASGPPNWTR